MRASVRMGRLAGATLFAAAPSLAANDARAVGAALKELGFDVIAGENLSRRAMSR